jgi:hypothetical protein
MGGSGSSYFESNHPSKNFYDDGTPVESDALVDPDRPGHRDAIKKISHVEGDKHEKIIQWLKAEIHQDGHGSDPQK